VLYMGENLMSAYALVSLCCIIFTVCFNCYFMMDGSNSSVKRLLSSMYCSILTTIVLIFTFAILIYFVSNRWILQSVMSIENANKTLYIRSKDGHYLEIGSTRAMLIPEPKSSGTHD